MTVGEKIKTIRKEKRITQAKLSQLTGIAEITIRQYEAGKYKPKFEQLIKLSAALGVSISDLDSDTYLKLTLDEQSLSDALNHLLQDTVSEKDLNILNTFMNSKQFKELERKNGNFCKIREDRLRVNKLLSFYDQLNQYGQDKLTAYAEDLTKIPEYRKQSDTSEESTPPDVLAAHTRTDIEQTPEGTQHDLDIMDDDSEWNKE